MAEKQRARENAHRDAHNRRDRTQEEIEDREWLESLEYVLENEDPDRVQRLFRKLHTRAQKEGVEISCPGTTAYLNTIPRKDQPPYPGSREIERRIKSINRWNAMAMVVRANKEESGIGGHISTYASQATLFEVAFNHFLRARGPDQDGDICYFQGHASPGLYARAFLEGRLSEQHLVNFRRELQPEHGLSSYPHPWLMPEFWQYPSVSMGLAPIMSIYQARFNRYLADRGIKDTSDQRVWAFLGDGEMDEPESMGAITLASREKLDNLIFVINCNLQRLDGPVRGNGQIIQELEAAFRGAGWRVIKVIWGGDWDPLFEKDDEGLLAQRMECLVDGQAQKYAVSGGDYIRKDFFGTDERLLAMVESYSDEQLEKMRRGGHDPEKVYAAYAAAVETDGRPTVVLAQTIKGYGLGEAGEGRNVTHQQKKLNEQELMEFRSRFGIPISDDQVDKAPFYVPPEDSEEMRYLHERRKELGGYLPERSEEAEPLELPPDEVFDELLAGTEDREVATTMVLVRLLSKLLQDEGIGKRIVPIVPDESRTFGMESLFRQVGIYSHAGQVYEPVDKESLLYYKEAKDGAILEEGITEAGSISSFIAAGTSYATHGVTMIPFFIFYSMFGFQRVGDLVWAAGDARARGFLVGGTSGRTTLPGEGLQHQDGQSHVYAYAYPNIKAYDPAFAYEIAVIVQDGLRRMYAEQEDIFYYITVMNEFYAMPAMPGEEDRGRSKSGKGRGNSGVRQGILRGLYRLQESDKPRSGKNKAGARAHLLASGTILLQALKAAEMLEERFDVAADVWSATSWKELYMDGIETERWNRLHPGEERRRSYLEECFDGEEGAAVAATDYLKALPLSVAHWMPLPFSALGTDGYGRSDTRRDQRAFFEVDARHIVLAALDTLARDGSVGAGVVEKALEELEIDPEAPNPVTA